MVFQNELLLLYRINIIFCTMSLIMMDIILRNIIISNFISFSIIFKKLNFNCTF